MQSYLMLSIELVLSLIAVVFIFLAKNRRVNELKEKTDFAVASDELVKVEMGGEDNVSKIAFNFNSLADKLSKHRKSNVELSGIKEEKLVQDQKIKTFEDSLSQMNLLTDIGRQITSCLTVRDIALKLFRNINSSMIAEEVSLLILSDSAKKYYSVTNQKIEEIKQQEWCEDRDNILNWCFDNNKEAYLNDASKDYGQYVFKPLRMAGGKNIESLVAIPLGLSDHMIGAVSVSSSGKNNYNNFHLDFTRSMASYVSVAIYNANLYSELGEEKRKSEELLLNILPVEIANELKEKGKTEAKQFESVSVLFTDFMNFTGISEKLTPKQLVTELDTCFKAFDDIVGKYGLEKIKTIGDAYLAVCGLPHETTDHAIKTVNAGLEMQDFLNKNDTIFKMRVGINSGPVVAGIVGSKKYAYDIWGDTVNTAARMEQNGEIGRINVSGATYNLIKDRVKCEYRGKINAKNKGEIDMYFVLP